MPNSDQLAKIQTAPGFIAALDQSGGSTPKTLALYGVGEDAYENEYRMFDVVHDMRARIVGNSAFSGDAILAAILFEDTVDRGFGRGGVADYLWRDKQIIPLMKVDEGLAPRENGVQTMKPFTRLDFLLSKCRAQKIFGTKMRSVIHAADAGGIKAVVAQQFEIGKTIIAHDLVPIIEPEVNIAATDKATAEEILRDELTAQLDALKPKQKVILKLTLPETVDFYHAFTSHPNCIRVAALSGGYSREEAVRRLGENRGMVASFSRALTEGLRAQQNDAEFTAALGASIAAIAAASAT